MTAAVFNYIQEGDELTFANTSSADIASGDVVAVGSLLGIAQVAIAKTTGVGTVSLQGVFMVPKTAGEAWTPGAVLTWDVDAGGAGVGAFALGTVAGSGNISVNAVAWTDSVTGEAAIEAATEGLVKINVGNGAVA